jgi:hypothetical protein
MDKVRKPSNSVCYTPSSEPYRIPLAFSDSFEIRITKNGKAEQNAEDVAVHWRS